MAADDETTLEDFLALSDADNGKRKLVARLRTEIQALKIQLAQHGAVTHPTPQTHLIIGDSHSDPAVPNDRFDWLGKLIADVRPDVVVDIGDQADMGSLSHYDEGKRSSEGRRYQKDINHSIDARERINHQLRGLAKRPRRIVTLGNHEYRIVKATDNDPKLDGFMSTSDLRVEELGWEQFDFGVPAFVDGIGYCHYFPSGINGRPVGGMHLASALIRLGLMSGVQGHSHTFDYAERTRSDGMKVLGMSVGCYFDHFMEWAGASNSIYWRGIVVLRDIVDGYGQVEKISIDSIRREYGP